MTAIPEDILSSMHHLHMHGASPSRDKSLHELIEDAVQSKDLPSLIKLAQDLNGRQDLLPLLMAVQNNIKRHFEGQDTGENAHTNGEANTASSDLRHASQESGYSSNTASPTRASRNFVDQQSTVVDVAPDVVGFFAAKGGQRLHQVMAATECRIWLDQAFSSNEPHKLHLTGKKQQIEAALMMLDKQLRNSSQGAEQQSSPPSYPHGMDRPTGSLNSLDASAGRATRDLFRNGSLGIPNFPNAPLNDPAPTSPNSSNSPHPALPPNRTPSPPIHNQFPLPHNPSSLLAAHLGSQAPPYAHRHAGPAVLDCPPHLVGLLIGKRGWTVKKIQQDSGAQISINQMVKDGQPRKVYITGSKQSTEKAQRMIQEVLSYPGPAAQALLRSVQADAAASIAHATAGNLGLPPLEGRFGMGPDRSRGTGGYNDFLSSSLAVLNLGGSQSGNRGGNSGGYPANASESFGYPSDFAAQAFANQAKLPGGRDLRINVPPTHPGTGGVRTSPQTLNTREYATSGSQSAPAYTGQNAYNLFDDQASTNPWSAASGNHIPSPERRPPTNPFPGQEHLHPHGFPPMSSHRTNSNSNSNLHTSSLSPGHLYYRAPEFASTITSPATSLSAASPGGSLHSPRHPSIGRPRMEEYSIPIATFGHQRSEQSEPSDVSDFLHRLGLGHLAPIFLQYGFDMEALRIMQEPDFAQLGIDEGSRLRILNAMMYLAGGGDATTLFNNPTSSGHYSSAAEMQHAHNNNANEHRSTSPPFGTREGSASSIPHTEVESFASRDSISSLSFYQNKDYHHGSLNPSQEAEHSPHTPQDAAGASSGSPDRPVWPRSESTEHYKE